MKPYLVVITVVLLSGCALTPPTTPVASAPPSPVTVAPVAETEIDPRNAENLRVAETSKAYPVGRTIDPIDPDVMHEAHIIYRRESGSSWNLNPNAPTVVPLGPTLAIADPARTPSPLPAELERTMAEQTQLVASLVEQNEVLGKELGELSRQLSEMKRAQGGKETGK